MVHTQFSAPIKTFCLDSGGEYLSDVFLLPIFDLEGTLAQLSCHDAHAHNGVDEQKHRHIIEDAHSFFGARQSQLQSIS